MSNRIWLGVLFTCSFWCLRYDCGGVCLVLGFELLRVALYGLLLTSVSIGMVQAWGMLLWDRLVGLSFGILQKCGLYMVWIACKIGS